MYKAVFSNAPEFDGGYKKVIKRDAAEDFISGYGSKDTTVNSFVFGSVFVTSYSFMLCCCTSLLFNKLAVGFYFNLTLEKRRDV